MLWLSPDVLERVAGLLSMCPPPASIIVRPDCRSQHCSRCRRRLLPRALSVRRTGRTPRPPNRPPEPPAPKLPLPNKTSLNQEHPIAISPLAKIEIEDDDPPSQP